MDLAIRETKSRGRTLNFNFTSQIVFYNPSINFVPRYLYLFRLQYLAVFMHCHER